MTPTRKTLLLIAVGAAVFAASVFAVPNKIRSIIQTPDTPTGKVLSDDGTWVDAPPASDLSCTNCIGGTEIDESLLSAVPSASALAADPADCAANQFAQSIAASGNLTCAAISDADVPDSITVSLAAAATALAANGANCSAGNYPLGVDASGAAESCTADDDVPEAADYSNLTAGRSITAPSAGTIDADVELYEHTKCITIESPADADNLLFFRAERAITLTGIDCLVNAATSAVLTLQECNANGGTCGTSEAATCATTNTTETGGIDDSAVAAGAWMRIDVGTVTGSVGQVSFCVTYTVND